MGNWGHSSVWPERDNELRLHWASELSTAAIGEAMNLSKNQIVGRAHRLGLPPRPSPIKRGGEPRVDQMKVRVRESTLKSLVLVKAEPFERPAPEPPAPVRRPGKVEPCCYPIGTPRTPSFRYCDAPSEPGKPYCLEHCTKVYASYGAEPAYGKPKAA